MGVQDLGRRGQQQLPEMEDAIGIPQVMSGQGEHGETLGEGADLQGAFLRADNNLFMAALAETARQAKQLPLPATQLATRVDMDYPQQA
jgi:hypothetical protein